jgi:hypothetical protein
MLEQGGAWGATRTDHVVSTKISWEIRIGCPLLRATIVVPPFERLTASGFPIDDSPRKKPTTARQSAGDLRTSTRRQCDKNCAGQDDQGDESSRHRHAIERCKMSAARRSSAPAVAADGALRHQLGDREVEPEAALGRSRCVDRDRRRSASMLAGVRVAWFWSSGMLSHGAGFAVL